MNGLKSFGLWFSLALILCVQSMTVSSALKQSSLSWVGAYELLFFTLILYQQEKWSIIPVEDSTESVRYSWSFRKGDKVSSSLWLCASSDDPLYFLDWSVVQQEYLNDRIFYHIALSPEKSGYLGSIDLTLLNPHSVRKSCSGLTIGERVLPLSFNSISNTSVDYHLYSSRVRFNLAANHWDLNSAGGYQAVIECPKEKTSKKNYGERRGLLVDSDEDSSNEEPAEDPKKKGEEKKEGGSGQGNPPPDPPPEAAVASVVNVNLEAQFFDLIQNPEYLEFLAQHLFVQFPLQPDGLTLFVQLSQTEGVVGLAGEYTIDVWRRLLLYLKQQGIHKVRTFLTFFREGGDFEIRMQRAISDAARQAANSDPGIFTHGLAEMSANALSMFPQGIPGFIQTFVTQQQIPMPAQYSEVSWVVIFHWLQNHPGAAQAWLSIATRMRDWSRMDQLRSYIRPEYRTN
jgi:hypothetical protein